MPKYIIIRNLAMLAVVIVYGALICGVGKELLTNAKMCAFREAVLLYLLRSI